MTDIALKVEQVSSTNAANDYIISLPTGYIRNLCHWFCNHLCVNGLIAWMSTYYLSTDGIRKKSVPLVLQPLMRERADSLDVNCDIPVDLANSRTCESYNSVLAEAAVRVAKIGVHIVRQTT